MRREKIKSQFLNLWIRYNIRISATVGLHNNLTKKKKGKILISVYSGGQMRQ